jgi:hypothetical protein
VGWADRVETRPTARLTRVVALSDLSLFAGLADAGNVFWLYGFHNLFVTTPNSSLGVDHQRAHCCGNPVVSSLI